MTSHGGTEALQGSGEEEQYLLFLIGVPTWHFDRLGMEPVPAKVVAAASASLRLMNDLSSISETVRYTCSAKNVKITVSSRRSTYIQALLASRPDSLSFLCIVARCPADGSRRKGGSRLPTDLWL